MRWIQLQLRAGLSSSTIRDFLPCAESGEVTPDVLSRLAHERDRVDQQIAHLLTVRERLDGLITAATEHSAGCRVPARPLSP